MNMVGVFCLDFWLNMTLPVQVTPLLCLLFVCPAFCLQVRNASSAVSQRCSRDSVSENPASMSFTCTLMMLTSTSEKEASAKSEPLGFKGHPASRGQEALQCWFWICQDVTDHMQE